MSNKEFSVFLGIVMVPFIVQLIAEKKSISFSDATQKFYNSKVYALLEREETKLWHYSHQLICELFLQEDETGDFELPEAAA